MQVSRIVTVDCRYSLTNVILIVLRKQQTCMNQGVHMAIDVHCHPVVIMPDNGGHVHNVGGFMARALLTSLGLTGE